MERVKEDFLANTASQLLAELWTSFKSSVNEGISRFVPSNKNGSKRSLPWITQEIKRLIRKTLFTKGTKGHQDQNTESNSLQNTIW